MEHRDTAHISFSARAEPESTESQASGAEFENFHCPSSGLYGRAFDLVAECIFIAFSQSLIKCVWKINKNVSFGICAGMDLKCVIALRGNQGQAP